MSEEVKSHLHESPRSMTVPLMILAVLSVIGGFVGMPHIFGVTNYFEHWLEPVMTHGQPAVESHALAAGAGNTGSEWGLMFASVILVLVSIYCAYLVYQRRTELATSLRQKFSGLHRVLVNKYYVDEFYGAVVVRPVIYLSLFLWKVFDVVVIDGFLNGMAALYHDISEFVRAGQTGRVRTYATVFLFGAVLVAAFLILD